MLGVLNSDTQNNIIAVPIIDIYNFDFNNIPDGEYYLKSPRYFNFPQFGNVVPDSFQIYGCFWVNGTTCSITHISIQSRSLGVNFGRSIYCSGTSNSVLPKLHIYQYLCPSPYSSPYIFPLTNNHWGDLVVNVLGGWNNLPYN